MFQMILNLTWTSYRYSCVVFVEANHRQIILAVHFYCNVLDPSAVQMVGTFNHLKAVFEC